MKLSKKIIISFLSIIILSILITSLISSHRINNEFELYLIEEHENKLDKIAQTINAIYVENNYILYREQIDSYANSENVSIIIRDIDGNPIYQSLYNPSYNGAMMPHGNHMMRRSPVNQADYIEKVFPLLKNNTELGEIIIGFYDNSYITKSALIFKDTLNISFVLSGLLSLLLSLFLAFFLSRNLSRPLVRITRSTRKLEEGNFKIDLSSEIHNSTWEISQLAKSINILSLSLENQEKIRNQYALDISHELRTPITTIKGYLEAILDDIWEADSSNLEVILEEINRISNLVDDLKDSFLLSSLDENQDLATINLSQQVKDIVNLYQPSFIEDRLVLNCEIEEDLYFKINPNHFRQILTNLISNGKKYITPGQGRLDLSLRQDKAFIILKIEDNGIGMPKESLPFIFNRLYRVDSSRNKVTGGSGIGLYIVQKLVAMYGGKVEVDSREGLGTCFTISFQKN